MFKLDRDLIVIDLETSGVTDQSSVIQIGAVRFTKYGELKTEEYFDALVKTYNPEWSSEAEAVHGMSKAYVDQNGMSIHDALTHFSKWVYDVSRKYCYLAQWSCGFDVAMLERAYKYAGFKFPFTHRAYDIASITRFYIARKGYNPSKGLADTHRLLGVDNRSFKSHYALDDAKMAGLCLEKVIQNDLKEENSSIN